MPSERLLFVYYSFSFVSSWGQKSGLIYLTVLNASWLILTAIFFIMQKEFNKAIEVLTLCKLQLVYLSIYFVVF